MVPWALARLACREPPACRLFGRCPPACVAPGTSSGETAALAPQPRVASANSMASTSSPMVCGFRIPAACRRGRGRARRNRSTTTRSVTWAALGSPASSQCCERRDSSAAWARAGTRLLYSQAWNNWAAEMGERPTRARISFRSSS